MRDQVHDLARLGECGGVSKREAVRRSPRPELDEGSLARRRRAIDTRRGDQVTIEGYEEYYTHGGGGGA